MHPRSLASLALLFATAAPAGAQVRTVLYGVVTNINGVRLKGVEVAVVNSALLAVTDDSGQFRFNTAPNGRVRLTARMIGFKPLEKGFRLDAGGTKQVDFELEGIADMLDSVMVYGRGGTGRMAEFYARRTIGVGAFITRADIERRNPMRASDLLRTVNGVRVVMASDNGLDRPRIQMGRNPVMTSQSRNDRSLGGACIVSYYVDGSWVPPGTFHLDDISPIGIEAIEIYRGPAETPARFRQRETACGLIVIWTREPPARVRTDTTGWTARQGR